MIFQIDIYFRSGTNYKKHREKWAKKVKSDIRDFFTVSDVVFGYFSVFFRMDKLQVYRKPKKGFSYKST